MLSFASLHTEVSLDSNFKVSFHDKLDAVAINSLHKLI